MEKDLKEELSLALERLLAKKKIKKKDFAGMMGVSPSTISKWLRGNHNFTLDTIQRIEKATGEYLVGIML